jgi:hypothetical protein
MNVFLKMNRHSKIPRDENRSPLHITELFPACHTTNGARGEQIMNNRNTQSRTRMQEKHIQASCPSSSGRDQAVYIHIYTGHWSLVACLLAVARSLADCRSGSSQLRDRASPPVSVSIITEQVNSYGLNKLQHRRGNHRPPSRNCASRMRGSLPAASRKEQTRILLNAACGYQAPVIQSSSTAAYPLP